MKDFKELINIADVYGTETKGLAEKREAEIQKHLDEGIWDDLVGGISGLAKKLGIDPATADKVANAISTQPEAKAEVEKADPGTDPTGNTSGKPNPGDDPTGNTSGKPAAGTDQEGGVAQGMDQADAAAEKPAGLDVTTPNLMKAYNSGGKKAMPSITAMQTALQKAGFDPKGVDGKYGPGTFAAVKEFQTAQGLKADGQAGPETMKALQATAAPVAKPTPKPAAPTAQSAPTQPSGGAATGSDGNPTGAAATATAPDGNPTAPPADQAAAQASQQGVAPDNNNPAGAGQANAGVDGADQAELDAGAGQANDPMSPTNQAADRRDKKPKGAKVAKTDRQQMASTVTEASMNISMNGTDSKEVAELVGILKNAGMDEPEAMAIKSLPISIGKSPMGMDDPMGHDHDHSPMGMDDPRDSSPLHSMKSSPCGEEDEAEYNALIDEWDNSPDPEYKDDDYMLNDLAGGLNRPKKSYPATQPGDNPMAVKEALWAALNKKMTEGDKMRGKKMKLKASRGNEDIKTTEGSRGKKSRGKKSRG
tara:strand:- start:4981 stop:6588 length:1608 start_codon:yes stop_codon:yes gene_type:complete